MKTHITNEGVVTLCGRNLHGNNLTRFYIGVFTQTNRLKKHNASYNFCGTCAKIFNANHAQNKKQILSYKA